ncbi:MAG: T9SS type A sorting domain-containing protein [Ignavibacteria bacterium]
MKKLISTFVLALILNSAFCIQNSQAQWSLCSGFNPNINAQSVTSTSTLVFASTGADCVYKSTNNGANFTQTTYFSYGNIPTLGVIGSTVIAGSNGNGVYTTVNNGTNWIQTSLDHHAIISMAISGSTIYAGILDSGVFISPNGGVSWVQSSLNNKTVRALAVSGSYVYAGTMDTGGVYVSSNNGSTWVWSSLNNKSIYALAVIGANVYAGTRDHGIYTSTNYGTTWVQNSINSSTVSALLLYDNKIFAGVEGLGIFMSTNNGSSWIEKNDGLPVNTFFNQIYITGNYIFAATQHFSLWRRPLSEVISIKNISTEIPSAFSLSQNYPNPFNPTTVIRFQLSVDSKSLSSPHGLGGDLVQLKVYDIMGREVATLVNEQLAPGTYETTFDGSALSSGTYFYKLTSGNFTQTKKLTLLK